MVGCNLRNTTLECGAAAFQSAIFDESVMLNARLSAGVSSFQNSSFADADLTGAILRGGRASFQGASFENATLIGGTLIGDFQTANFSGTRFEDADLSRIPARHLSTVHFNVPPTFNANTKFPVGFDPKPWTQVDE